MANLCNLQTFLWDISIFNLWSICLKLNGVLKPNTAFIASFDKLIIKVKKWTWIFLCKLSKSVLKCWDFLFFLVCLPLFFSLNIRKRGEFLLETGLSKIKLLFENISNNSSIEILSISFIWSIKFSGNKPNKYLSFWSI